MALAIKSASEWTLSMNGTWLMIPRAALPGTLKDWSFPQCDMMKWNCADHRVPGRTTWFMAQASPREKRKRTNKQTNKRQSPKPDKQDSHYTTKSPFAYPGAWCLFSPRQKGRGRGGRMHRQGDCFLPGNLSRSSEGMVPSSASTVSNLKMKLNVAEHPTAQREAIQQGTLYYNTHITELTIHSNFLELAR